MIDLFPRAVKSQFGRRDLTGRDHWHTLDIDEYRIVKPTIICFGGNGTCDDPDESEIIPRKSGTQKANSFCRVLESLLGLKIEQKNIYSSYNDIDVLGFSYGKNSRDSRTGLFSGSDIQKIVDNLLVPLFLDSEGKYLEVSHAAKNFSYITFFTHCHGSREHSRVMGRLFDELKASSAYSDDEIMTIFAHSFHVSYCPLLEEVWMPTVRVQSMGDKFQTGLDEMYFDCYGKVLDGIDVRYDDETTFMGKPVPEQIRHKYADKVTIFTSRMLNNDKTGEPIDEHPVELLARNSDWRIKRDGKNLDAVSTMVAHALGEHVACSLNNYRNNRLDVPVCVSAKSLMGYFEDIKSGYSEEELAR